MLAFPALAALRARHPGARLHLVGNRLASPLALALRPRGETSQLADGWTDFDDPALAALFVTGSSDPRLPSFGPVEIAVAWCADPVGALTENLGRLGARVTVVAPSRPDPSVGRHTAAHLLETLAPLGVEGSLDLRSFVLEPASANGRRGAQLLTEYGLAPESFFVVQPGSGSPAKNWPPEHFATLIDSVSSATGLRPVACAGPADAAALARLVRHARTPPMVLSNVPLPQLAVVLRSSVFYVGNDSGPTHLAGMLGCPTIAIFGPTDPAIWAPLGPRTRVVEATDLDALRPETVVKTVHDLLQWTRSGRSSDGD